MFRNLISYLAILCWVAFGASMLVSAYFSVRASINRNPGEARHWLVRSNPFNAVYFPDELSPVGLAFRAKSFRAAKLMLVSAIGFGAACVIQFVGQYFGQ
jgi:hypothetical protein